MELFTVKEVADKLKVNPETVYRWLRTGKLKGILIGETIWRVSDAVLAEFAKGDGKNE